jgi:hypothetical protein
MYARTNGELWLLELGLEVAVPAIVYFLIWFGRRLFYGPRAAQFRLPPNTTYGSGGEVASQHSIQETTTTPLLSIQLVSPYRQPWTQAFDGILVGGLLLAAVVLGVLMLATSTGKAVWSNQWFWLSCVCCLVASIIASIIGGLLVRCNAVINDDGYVLATIPPLTSAIVISQASVVFLAWLIPVVFTPIHSSTLLQRSLADWFTLLGFLPLIKPLRERCAIFMVQFSAIDLPSERPRGLRLVCVHTLLVYAYQLAVLWSLQRVPSHAQ